MQKLTIVIPALNEERTISGVVSAFRDHSVVSEIIVVDNNSTDRTACEAESAGAQVIKCTTPGAGAAVTTGIQASKNNWVFKCDGDIRNPRSEWIDRLVNQVDDGVGLVKGNWHSPEDDLPVANLVVKPGLTLFFPELAYVEMPITGIYLVDRSCLIIDHLYNDFSFDLQIAVQIHLLGREIRQVFLGDLLHRQKTSAEYTGMAVELLAYLVNVHGGNSSERVTVFSDSCENAFLWAGGTMLKYLLSGANVRLATPCVQRVEENAIANFLSRFSRFSLAAMDGSEEDGVWHFLEADHTSTVCVFPADNENAVPSSSFELARETTTTYARQYLYTDHRTGGIVRGERPLCSIDISPVASIKRHILVTNTSGVRVDDSRISSLSDELNGLRCGAGFAEVFTMLPITGPWLAGGFL